MVAAYAGELSAYDVGGDTDSQLMHAFLLDFDSMLFMTRQLARTHTSCWVPSTTLSVPYLSSAAGLGCGAVFFKQRHVYTLVPTYMHIIVMGSAKDLAHQCWYPFALPCFNLLTLLFPFINLLTFIACHAHAAQPDSKLVSR